MPDPRVVPFAAPLCYALALPGVVGWAAWFVLPTLLEGEGEPAELLVVPFLFALAATSIASAMIAFMLGAPRRALIVNIALNIGFPVFLAVMWVLRR